MKLKKYLKDRDISAYAVAKGTGIPYSTINDLVNGKTDVERMQYGAVKTISGFLDLNLQEFEKLCRNEQQGFSGYRIQIKNKSYYGCYVTNDGVETVERLCKVNAVNTKYIETMAEWRWNRIQAEEVLKNWKHSIT